MEKTFKEGDTIIIDCFSSHRDGCPGEWIIEEIILDPYGSQFEAFITNKAGELRIEYIHSFKKVK